MKKTITLIIATLGLTLLLPAQTNTPPAANTVNVTSWWERRTNEVEGPIERIPQPDDTAGQTVFKNPVMEPHAWNHRIHREIVSNLVVAVEYKQKTNYIIADTVLVHATNYSWRLQRSTN